MEWATLIIHISIIFTQKKVFLQCNCLALRVRKKCALTIHLIDLQTLNNELRVKKKEERRGKRIDDEENF